MSDERCIPFQENLAAYALGALDADEARALEMHLQRCTACRAELAKYRAVSEGLLAALPPRAPSPGLKRRLTARLSRSGTRRKTASSRSKRLFQGFAWGRLAATVAFVVLIAVNLFSLVQIRDLQARQTALTERLETEQAVVAMLAYPGTRNIPVHPDVEGIAGQMLLDANGRVATLILWNMPRPQEGAVYQAWLIDEKGERISGGLFTPQEGRTFTVVVIQAPAPLETFAGLGVTVEPQGGSPAPTGPRLLSVDF